MFVRRLQASHRGAFGPLSALLIATLLVSCRSDALGPALDLDDIGDLTTGELRINPTELILQDGASGFFALRLLKSDGTLLTNFPGASKAVWASLAPGIAGVSNNGAVHAKLPGYTMISATLGDRTVEAPVIVLPTPSDLRPLFEGELSGGVGASLADAVGVLVVDRGGLPVPGVEVTFRVELGGGSVFPAKVLTGANGTAKTVWQLGSSAGENALSASAPGLEAVVMRAHAEAGGDDNRLELVGGDEQEGVVGEELPQDLTVRVVDRGGNPVSNADVEWIFEGEQGAAGGGAGSLQTSKSDTDGYASTRWQLGTTAGAQLVTARVGSDGSEQWFKAKAKPGKVKLVQVTPSSVTLGVEEQVQLDAAAYDRFGNRIETARMVWSSSDAGVASVTSSGTVKAIQPGSALVTAQSGKVSASASVSVQQVGPASMALVSGNGQSGEAGNELTQPFIVKVMDASGNPLSGVDVSWRVTQGGGSLGQPASKTDGSGNARVIYTLGATAGVNQVRAQTGGLSPVTFTASATAGVIAEVEVAPSSLTLSAGQSRTLVATALDASGNSVPGADISWSSTDAGVVSVDASGTVTAGSSGTATISAKAGGATGTATVTVTRDVTRVVISTPAATLNAIGDTARYQAEALDAGGQPISGTTITWASLDPSIATVDPLGRVVSKGVGTATITATAGAGISDSAGVTSRQVIAGIQITPSDPSVEKGSSVQLNASAADSNGVAVPGVSFQWASSNTTVATVSGTGDVQGLETGTALISAALSSGGTSNAGSEQASVPAGSTSVSVQAVAPPPGAPSTWIFPGDDLAAKVAAHPDGTTFTIKAGVHRMQQASPGPGTTFIGEPGAVLNGAVVIQSFTPSAGGWEFSAPQPTGLSRNGQAGNCRWERAGKLNATDCWSPQDLFWDGTALTRVGSQSQVGPGKWYLDETTRVAFVAEDPTGHTVELSSHRVAFSVLHASGVRIEGLVIEKYASYPGYGAIQVEDSHNVVIQNNVIRKTHGAGIVMFVANNNRIVNNDIYEQGQIGISTWRADDLQIEGNRIDRNNQAVYDVGWEAGAMKMVRSVRPTVRNNDISRNIGKGIWTDADNTDALFEGNRILDNTSHGIFHEVSCGGIIRNNTVRGNGTFGIVISGSPDTEISNNTVGANGWVLGGSKHKVYGEILARTVGRTASATSPCEWQLTNVRFHHNTIEVDTSKGTVPAAILFRGGNYYLPTGGVQFFDNTYVLSGGQAERFRFDTTWEDRSAWQARGYDVTSTFQIVP